MYPVSEQVPSKQEKKALLDDMIEEMKTKYQRLVEHPEEREDADELNRRYSVVKNRATLIVAVDLFRSYELAIAYNERGQLFYRMIEFDKAVEDYTEAIKYCGALAAPYYNRGTIRYRMGYFDLALPDMEKAVQLQPSNADFQKGLQETREQL
ncbi:hypothetical protein HPB48_024400 [Haemaphysalis longicornis]|uniref:Tetratricopeptide repeat protein 32 n=1 Tax=Haemaphysalis longicornis TaxID=44386 RepID=A0A9J6H8L4_HAELO|nr:hypothetical protein HPB48_024400 [Haemaphysalis longicornis]